MTTSELFTPLTIRGVTLKNRIAVSPMCQYCCDKGMVGDWHLVNYGSFATGGAGLVMVESTAVEERGRITPGCPGLWNDQQIKPWKRVTQFIRSQGAVAAIQLAHAGRKASTVPPWVGRDDSLADEDGGWPTIGVSAIEFGGSTWKVPKEATLDDLQDIKEAWVSAALRAVEAGFQVIELHFAHGYLICTFLSPITNKRTDRYGGSLENRMRFGLEIAEAVRTALPDHIPVGVRLSVTDYCPNGWDVEQSVVLAKRLKAIGIDFIDCSSGGIDRNVKYGSMNTPDVQWRAAHTIQTEANIPTCAVGKITDPLTAERLLRDKWATIVFIGRAFLNNPHWPYLAADRLADPKTFQYPNQYEWCIGWNALTKWRQQLRNDINNNEKKLIEESIN